MFSFCSLGESLGALVAEFIEGGMFWAAALSCSRAIPNPKARANFNPFFIIVCYACLFSAVPFTRRRANVQQEYAQFAFAPGRIADSIPPVRILVIGSGGRE